MVWPTRDVPVRIAPRRGRLGTPSLPAPAAGASAQTG
jgi:hypothetical protein